MQNKLKDGNLLNADGTLAEAGYATSLVKRYNPENIKAKKCRIKEWDYYLVYNSKYALALTVADNRYMGLVSASLIDFSQPTEKTTSLISWFTNGKTNLPKSSATGLTKVDNKASKMEFEVRGKKRTLKFFIKDFLNGKPLSGEIALTSEPQDSMVIATPFAGKPKAFYYNQKIVGFEASGTVMLGTKKIVFSPADSVGILDWGRGVWTYKNTWFWSGLAGKLEDGKMFGFNFGYGFGDTSNATENMIFLNGYAHKIDRVEFVIPKTKRGKDDFMRPWKISSGDGAVDLDFYPIIDRKACTDVLILKSDQHQVFGKFSGTVMAKNGKKVEVKNMLGFAEKVTNKW